MAQPKVAVIGVGSIGSMVLWQLTSRGVEAVGFEQYGLAHDRSAAGGESRMFRTAYMEGADYVPLLQRSRQLWRQLESDSGHKLLDLIGGLMIGPADHDKIRNAIRSTEDFDIDHEILNASETMHRFPQHRLNEDDVAILDKEAGVLRPELAVFAAAERARYMGAAILTHTPVESVEETAEGVVVRAAGQEYLFDGVVVAAGPWTHKLFPPLAENLLPRKIVMTWYLSDQPEQYTPEHFPVFARVGGEISIFGIPTLEGSMTKIGSVDTFGEVPEPDHLQRDVSLAELNKINAEVRHNFPGLNPDPSRISVHMDGFTTDEHAVVGHRPGSQRIVLMGGYSGHGFKLAPVMGEIGAQLALEGTTEHSLGHLDPARFLAAVTTPKS